MSPTSRSLLRLKVEGFTAEVVERWIPGANIRRDFIGCIDIICFHPFLKNVMGIQATTTGNMTKRIEKSSLEPRLTEWLKIGQRFQVWGWAKRGKVGKRKLWSLNKVEAYLDFNKIRWRNIL